MKFHNAALALVLGIAGIASSSFALETSADHSPGTVREGEFPAAGHSDSGEQLKTTNGSSDDCRFEGIGTVHADNARSSRIEVFPENDVFRPLMADPKQPQFFAFYQNVRVRDSNTSFTAGLRWIWRKLRFGWQTERLQWVAGRYSRRRLCAIQS